MELSEFTKNLENQIQSAYETGEYCLGWRLLASPCATLDGAEIAFLGLNPAGREIPPDHPNLCLRNGESAYVNEVWKRNCPAGESPLQIQVLSLFQHLSILPEKVLAGNLVPFRSGSWQEMKNKDIAVEFGRKIWSEIFARANPKLVITLGTPAWEVVASIYRINSSEKIKIGWGSISARKALAGKQMLVGLPHLSRFPIINRSESQQAVKYLFGSYWRA